MKPRHNKFSSQKDLSVIFGAFLRQKRIEAGMSQDALGQLIGVTFQQVQKYEKGANRISLALAYQVAQALQFDPVKFFAMEGNGAPVFRKHMEMNRVLCAFNDKELLAFKLFAAALGKN